jgi:hypothetical protein
MEISTGKFVSNLFLGSSISGTVEMGNERREGDAGDNAASG